MAEQKTKPTDQSVDAFLDKISSEQTRDDCRAISKIMKKITGASPKMWGPSIVGFGKYHYKYESGHEGDSCLAAFSPRKAAITIYFMLPDSEREPLLKRLGKHKSSKACIYVKKLADIDVKVLEEIVDRSFKYVNKLYPAV
ncbi:MAG: DUF1801 domain-containing protein [Chryseolinea sp.]